MKCPNCGSEETDYEQDSIRVGKWYEPRYYFQCLACGHEWTSKEV